MDLINYTVQTIKNSSIWQTYETIGIPPTSKNINKNKWQNYLYIVRSSVCKDKQWNIMHKRKRKHQQKIISYHQDEITNVEKCTKQKFLDASNGFITKQFSLDHTWDTYAENLYHIGIGITDHI